MVLVLRLKWVILNRTHELFYALFIKGWNVWNHFGCNYNETIIKRAADAIVSTGLAAAGYQYGKVIFLSLYQVYFFTAPYTVNLDDCWQVSRDDQGVIQPDLKAFPSGIPALVDYVHSKKVKFGLYTGI